MTTTNTRESVSGFSVELREATWGSHSAAEQSSVMRSLFDGTLSLAGYAELVAQQYLVYQVLEDAAARMRLDPVAGPFARAELTRIPALSADLRKLIGEDWTAALRPTQATRSYCDRLAEICFDWPGGFVAHHYVRYMGDLSGGQFIRRTVERVYGLTAAAGADFYEFGEIADLAAFKEEYRARLDDAPWDAIERACVIDEVLLAYELNTRVLSEL